MSSGHRAKPGLGAAALGNLYAAVTDSDASATLDAALASGWRWIDTAPLYGHGLAERRIGAWLTAKAVSDIAVSTKVGRVLKPVTGGDSADFGFVSADPFTPVFDYSAAGVSVSLDGSRDRLSRDYFECVFLHDLGEMTHGADAEVHLELALSEGLPELRRQQDQGRIGHVGLGVNEIEICENVLDRARIDVILLAGRYSLLEHDTALGFLDRCLSAGVKVVLGGIFNSGLLAGELSAKAKYNYAAVPSAVLERAQAIGSVCERYGIPLGAAALQFSAAHPAVERVLIGARSKSEVVTNQEWREMTVPHALWQDLRRAGLLSEGAYLP